MNKCNGIVITIIFCAVFFSSILSAQEIQTTTEEIQITDAKLGKDVKDRVLVDEDSTFTINSKVFLWLKISGAISETLTITWKIADKNFTTSLNIGGSPWRTWANKTVYQSGDWSVTISDGDGKLLKEIKFRVE